MFIVKFYICEAKSQFTSCSINKIIFIVVLDVMVFIAYLTGIGPFTAFDITTLLVGSGIIIVVGVWKSGGFTRS